jgi:hypothetical protein
VREKFTRHWRSSPRHALARHQNPDVGENTLSDESAFQCGCALNRINELLGTGVFNPNAELHPLMISAFTELMILTRDILAKCEDVGQRIDFSEDIIVDADIPVRDVTDAVVWIRDGVCHMKTWRRRSGNLWLSPLMVTGPNLINNKGVLLGCDYPDDVAFICGPQRLYLKRHVMRSLQAALEVLKTQHRAVAFFTKPLADPF